MSAIKNNNWYNLNTTRKYPVDDGATGVDDSGKLLPATVLSDINVRIPKSLGVGVMISSVVISDTLVSITFLATNHPIIYSAYDSPPAANSFAPLFAVSVTKPVVPGTAYPISPFVEGVAGWVVFGDGIGKNFNGRFSNPTQSALNPKTCRYYNDMPVSSIGKINAVNKLQGMITLIEGKDVSIKKETKFINGKDRTAIVFSLKDNVNQTVLSDYIGPCDKRPESKNCDKVGLEFLNTVGPDCNGNINIEFLEPFELALFENSSEGMAIDYPVGLIDACTRGKRLPDETGKLPSQYTDQCNPTNEADPDSGLEGSAELPPPISLSSSTLECIDLPACVSFDYENTPFWQVIKGSFNVTQEDSPIEICGISTLRSSSSIEIFTSLAGYSSLSQSSSEPLYGYDQRTVKYTDLKKVDRAYRALNLSQRNISLWYNCGYESTESIRIITDLYLVPGSSPENAGIVLNYRPNADKTSDEYYVVEINKNGSALNIRRFNGFTYITAASLKPLGIATDTWYRLEAIVEPSIVVNKTAITANLYSIPSMSLIGSVNTETSLYRPSTGRVGLTSNRTQAVFSFFSMENI